MPYTVLFSLCLHTLPHREYCIHHPAWHKTQLCNTRGLCLLSIIISQIFKVYQLYPCAISTIMDVSLLYKLVQSDYLSTPLIYPPTLYIILITCRSLLLLNTPTHPLESHPFPLSLPSSFVITLLFSTSFLTIHCVKPSFDTPYSETNLCFSQFSSLSKPSVFP